jgi:hypothetical protein
MGQFSPSLGPFPIHRMPAQTETGADRWARGVSFTLTRAHICRRHMGPKRQTLFPLRPQCLSAK